MERAQPGILAPIPAVGRIVTLGLSPGALVSAAALASLEVPEGVVIGLGDPLINALGGWIEELRPFPAVSGPGTSFPSTQGALWLNFGGDDPGEVLLRARTLVAALGSGFRVDEDVATFTFNKGRDLSGWEDGTENPAGERAVEVALVPSGAALSGGSFAAAQRWVHHLDRLESLSADERNHVIGRDLRTNEELADAPETAHVKRAAQESFDPEAFMLRRSMPWGNVSEHGLYFVAYGHSLSPFERVLSRMAGLEDGRSDALLRFTRPISGGYYFCPPLIGGRLDLRGILTASALSAFPPPVARE